MPAVDMPLKDLETYTGINPCPPDIDRYWADALAEMNAVEPNVEFVKAGFTSPVVECFDLYFTGVRGARIHAKFLKPKTDKKCPAVLQFHGYTGSCGDWSSKVGLAASGFVVAALDCRGQGGLSQDTGSVSGNTHHGHIIRGLNDDKHDMLMRHIFLDTAQLAKIVMELDYVDEKRVAAMGGSQGGALTIACGALAPEVCMLAPAYPFLCDYKRVWEMDLAVDAYAELKEHFRRCDPMHKREEKIFTKLGYIDLQFISKRIKGEVMMGVGLMDTICPPSTQYAMYNKITSKKRTVIYPDFGHEGLPEFNDMTFEFFGKLL